MILSEIDAWVSWPLRLQIREFDRVKDGCYHQIAGWSSLVARWAHNPKVGGSNPPPATIYGFEGLPA